METYARFVALDGLTFRQAAVSQGIRKGLAAQGYENIPVDPKTVKASVMRYAEGLQNQIISTIEKLLQDNARFGLTFDEWTSINGTRFVGMVLHYQNSQIFNLGLFKVTGSANAVNILELVVNALKKFGVDFWKHIVCIMTDGCNTMKKIGKDVAPVIQQLCFAHALQLSILDVLYKEKPKSQSQPLPIPDELI